MSSQTVPVVAPEPDPAPASPSASAISCDGQLLLRALKGLPLVAPGDDLPSLICASLARESIELADGDVVVVTSKVVSRAEGRFVDLSTVAVSANALVVAARVGKDPRLVELILRDALSISREGRDVLVVRHRLGFISANAGIDASNAVPPGVEEGSGPWALILPEDPDGSAARIRAALVVAYPAAPRVGIVITDSFGRPFRLGTVGAAIGVSGLPALWDRRGEPDLYGRVLEHTITALADQVAAAADLVAGQAAEGRAVVLVRGLSFPVGDHSARELVRPNGEDLYA